MLKKQYGAESGYFKKQYEISGKQADDRSSVHSISTIQSQREHTAVVKCDT